MKDIPTCEELAQAIGCLTVDEVSFIMRPITNDELLEAIEVENERRDNPKGCNDNG